MYPMIYSVLVPSQVVGNGISEPSFPYFLVMRESHRIEFQGQLASSSSLRIYKSASKTWPKADWPRPNRLNRIGGKGTNFQ